jgi:Tfp pilus assembly protein PilF
MSLASENPSIKISVAVAYARSGQGEKATAILNEMLHLKEDRYVPPAQLAYVYAALGEIDEAFMWLDQAFRQRDPSMTWIKGDPEFDSLRFDPRFEELMKKLGLE